VQNFTSLTITALWNMTPCNFADVVHYQQRKGELTKLSFCLVFLCSCGASSCKFRKQDWLWVFEGYTCTRERERGG